MPRVLILYNEPTLPPDHPDADSEHDILYTADCVAKVLQDAGLDVSRLGLTDDPSAVLAGIKAANPDVVFNLYEGMAKWGHTEAFVAGLMEMLRIPFTGSPTKPLLMCRSKPLTKQLLAGAGLPTAPFLVIKREPVPACHIPWPVIVKPGLEDASVGIEQKSVVTSQEQLEERVRYVLNTYGPPVLVEQFIRGREFNVAVLERNGQLETLPFSEILFEPPPDAPHLWHIVSFDAKWKPGTTDFTATPAVNPAKVTPEMFDEVSDLAIRAFELVGCRDYARVDFRVDEAGRPFILEVNPNPCISPLAGLAAALESAKLPYPDFVLGLIRSALRRGPRPELADGPSTPHTPRAAPPGPSSGTRIAIRRAIADDLPALIDLTEGTELFPPEERKRVAEAFRSFVVSGSSEAVLIAHRGDSLAGACLVRPADGSHGVGGVDSIVVSRSTRRCGVGRALMAAAEREASAAGWRILLGEMPSAAWAAAARQFFHAVGFRPAGELSDYYADGSARLTFAKQLPPPARPEVPSGSGVESAATVG